MADLFSLLHGSSNHTTKQRAEDDYYSTDPRAVDLLLTEESFSKTIWEPCCGGGHMSEALKAHGYKVLSSDIVDRGYPETFVWDFLSEFVPIQDSDIITNPPYKNALSFVEKAVNAVRDGGKVAMFLKLTFLAGQKRAKFFENNPPIKVCPFAKRINCYPNGVKKNYSAAVDFAWFIWIKGWKGETVVKWL